MDYQHTLLSDCDSWQDYYSQGWTKMSTSISPWKSSWNYIPVYLQVHFKILCRCEAKERIFAIGCLDFTFAHSTALPTVLAINRVWCRCQCCCSLVSSAYSRLYSNQVRLWPSPCKVSPSWKWIYFGLVLWVAPSVKMARSQHGHIPQPRLYFLILRDHEGRRLCTAANYREVWRLS